MICSKPFLRSLQNICEDCLYPLPSMMPDPECEGRRVQAVVEVLSRLPEDAYHVLVKLVDSFTWFLPHYGVRGMITPFYSTVTPRKKRNELKIVPYAKVLYLSPVLEGSAHDIVVAVVVHELAHLILGHNETGVDDSTYLKQEAEVYNAICRWGFEKEAKKHSQMHRRLETRTNNETKRFKTKLTRKGKGIG
jgi:hypothetical protein